MSYFYYSQACVERPPLLYSESGHKKQVALIQRQHLLLTTLLVMLYETRSSDFNSFMWEALFCSEWHIVEVLIVKST